MTAIVNASAAAVTRAGAIAIDGSVYGRCFPTPVVRDS
jgi:hypothetical protein